MKNPENDFRKYGRKIFETTTWNSFKRLSRFVAPQLIRFLRIKFADAGVENFINSIVKQNLEYREKNNVTRKDLFQLLIQLRNTGTVQLDNEWETVIKADKNQKKMSMEEVTAHSFAFYGAGFETSSSTLSFCLFELARNPEIQERVRIEIGAVLKKHNGEITYESVSEMKYLSLCIDGKHLNYLNHIQITILLLFDPTSLQSYFYILFIPRNPSHVQCIPKCSAKVRERL